MAQEMEAVVGLDVEADSFMKELQGIFDQAATLIGESVKGTGIKAAPDTTLDDDASPAKAMGGMAKGMGGLMKMAGKMLGSISLIAVVVEVFKPVLDILQSGVKLLSELLRPISDLLMFLLRPLLVLIKPIISTFRVLMAPFKQAAQQLSMAGTQALMDGNVTAGMEMLMASAGVLLGPFITIIVGEALKIATSALLGTIEMLVSTLLTLFAPIIDWFGGNTEQMKSQLSDMFSVAREGANEAITGLELAALQKMADGVNVVMDKFKGKYPEYTSNLEHITTDFSELSAGADTATTNLDILEDSLDISSSVDAFVKEMDKVRKALDKKSKTSSQFINTGAGTSSQYSTNLKDVGGEKSTTRPGFGSGRFRGSGAGGSW